MEGCHVEMVCEAHKHVHLQSQVNTYNCLMDSMHQHGALLQVDAALDLSHTQNIGRMIKTHFPYSQFIVVSLKEGMFNNANVIYRTKFVDGVSAVTRTVPDRRYDVRHTSLLLLFCHCIPVAATP